MVHSNYVYTRIIVLFILIFLSGCWDRVEIEERGFVIGSGIDLAEEQGGDHTQVTLTNQFVIPAGLGTPSEGGGAEQKAFTNLSASGNSVFDINRKMAKLTNRTPFYQHLKIIVLAEELVMKPYLLEDVMDLFIRDQEMRRGVHVVIAEGEARKILDIEPMKEKLPMLYIESMLKNSYKNAEIIEEIHVNDIHLYLLDTKSYIIPLITMEGNKIAYKGVAVFQGEEDRMVGSLVGDDLVGLNLVTGKVKEGSIEAEVEGKLMTLEILDASRKIKVKSKSKEKVVFSVDIKIAASIAETFGSEDFTKKRTLKIIEKALKEKVHKIVNQAIVKVKDDLKVDAFRLSSELYQKHYPFWEEIEEDWDRGENIFSKSEIEVKVQTEIKNAGVTNRTEKEGEK
ncbi:Ger(x)C family spore germination protein [Virgibacillus halodenitrificans]|uniref:Ger(x)C family spore germination protein n=1 Tax=Virgibacillus halodenitrificans TaxID=1482 RepID=UPI00138AC3CC|nr:Ger(x)C family spore germination protein [Virgibacillus halodenitrificans]MEC2159435.1 Ger(x)C family spore germination protein [Virgibacillus halodenitrificans]